MPWARNCLPSRSSSAGWSDSPHMATGPTSMVRTARPVAGSHSRIVPSDPPEASQLSPSGLTQLARVRTPPRCPLSSGPRGSPVSGSQVRMMASPPADVSRTLPSPPRHVVRARTPPACARQGRAGSELVPGRHTQIVPSSVAAASRTTPSLSRQACRAQTMPTSRANGSLTGAGAPLGSASPRSQIRTVPSSPPDASQGRPSESAHAASAQIVPVWPVSGAATGRPESGRHNRMFSS